MKILFTADLHLKLNAKNIPKDWQSKRFAMLFDKINIAAKDCDLIILGGDIFDKVPTLPELGFYFHLISKLTTRTIIYDGNHEATRKGQTFLSLLKEPTQAMNPLVTIVDDYYSEEEGFGIIPYCKLKEFAKNNDPHAAAGTNILFTHVRGNIPPYVKEEVPLEVFKPWKLVLAGDLHNHEDSQLNIVYPGAPMGVTFHRSKIKTGMITIDTDTLEWAWKEIRLPQLIRKTVNSTDEMKESKFDHIIYEIEGNVSDLADIDVNNPLLDKKIVNKSKESQLNLSSNLTVSEEIVMYLKTVQCLSDKQVEEVMEVWNDNITLHKV